MVKLNPGLCAPSYIMAIDPGSTESAYICLDTRTRKILSFGKIGNAQMLNKVQLTTARDVVCEEIRSYGKAVGATVFATCRYVGRIEQVCANRAKPFHLVGRIDVKKSLAPLPRRNDKDVRNALISLYGEPGNSKSPGKTYGITKDVWAAFGVAHAYLQNPNAFPPVI